MKRIMLLFAIVFLVLSVSGQSVVRRKPICKVNYGNIQLEQIVSETDTCYAMYIKTNNNYHPFITIDLGNKIQAIKMLNFLIDVKLENDDMVTLDNATNNIVTRGLFGSLRFHSEGRQFSGDVIKKYLKTFLDVLEGKETKKKVPAYMRNMDED